MTESAVFEWACAVLEGASTMTRLQSRGTLRLALKSAGLEPHHLNARQLRVIAIKLLPKELQKRGLDKVDEICAKLAECPDSIAVPADGADAIFGRLGRP